MTDHADTIRPVDTTGHGITTAFVEREKYDALLAERQQTQEERDAAFDAAGLPRTASLDDLIRHHRNNAGMAASGHEIAAEEWKKRAKKAEAERQRAQEERDAWKASAGAAADRIRELATGRQQAIDALREAHNRLLVIECDARYEDGNIEQAQKIEALLLKLGEKP